MNPRSRYVASLILLVLAIVSGIVSAWASFEDHPGHHPLGWLALSAVFYLLSLFDFRRVP